ncbi:hypothetical protein ABZ858_09920 [Streptomyces sp. NPDC047017]|uniref:hypothetical protein n=1 Tax=Streptomyces sp. NPDC047017 TaxID=3155024 RepID=UPI0033D9DB66
MHPNRAVRRTAPILLAAIALTACSSGHDDASAPPAATGTASSSASSPAAAPSSPVPSPSATSGYPTTDAAPGADVPAVRDSFAVLQATYNDGCTTPGNCEYFLNRVVDNLDDLYVSMKAGPKTPSHFATPVSEIHSMQESFGGDFSFPNLKRHQKLLLSTRDRVNTWMQSHPEDYR